jgi:multidrug resistance efflux pump
VRASQVKTAESTAAATAEIKTLQEKIAQLQASIEKRTQGHQTLASTVEERKVGVQKVLDFFQS